MTLRLLVLAAIVAAQHQASPTPASTMGTYGLDTKALPSATHDGCWLESAPATADSVHLQILCRRPAPGHHLGVLDVRRPFHAGTLVYDTDKFVGHCRITVRFGDERAVVTQEGRDQACGFGAYVDVGGTYLRLNNRRPPFDLAPIERRTPRRTSPSVLR
jgi:hypothetical protein